MPMSIKNKIKQKCYYINKSELIAFTYREIEISQLLHQMPLNKIAEKLNLSPYTINYYINTLKHKLKCATIKEIINKLNAIDFFIDRN